MTRLNGCARAAANTFLKLVLLRLQVMRALSRSLSSQSPIILNTDPSATSGVVMAIAAIAKTHIELFGRYVPKP